MITITSGYAVSLFAEALGAGELLSADGSFYEGEFRDNEKDGEGQNDSKAEIRLNTHDVLAEKAGTLKYADGSIYTGNFSKGQCSGLGDFVSHLVSHPDSPAI